mmetsp:Transcript_133116/g.244814  ORF Transcript_133116/g.244814 Transcript_133116/m.244814 type:complete len:108 (-) Transcript_133116:148-471(-)
MSKRSGVIITTETAIKVLKSTKVPHSLIRSFAEYHIPRSIVQQKAKRRQINNKQERNGKLLKAAWMQPCTNHITTKNPMMASTTITGKKGVPDFVINSAPSSRSLLV